MQRVNERKSLCVKEKVRKRQRKRAVREKLNISKEIERERRGRREMRLD